MLPGRRLPLLPAPWMSSTYILSRSVKAFTCLLGTDPWAVVISSSMHGGRPTLAYKLRHKWGVWTAAVACMPVHVVSLVARAGKQPASLLVEGDHRSADVTTVSIVLTRIVC